MLWSLNKVATIFPRKACISYYFRQWRCDLTDTSKTAVLHLTIPDPELWPPLPSVKSFTQSFKGEFQKFVCGLPWKNVMKNEMNIITEFYLWRRCWWQIQKRIHGFDSIHGSYWMPCWSSSHGRLINWPIRIFVFSNSQFISLPY